ncbi:hypothetical protein NC652_038334 [Populus alba x Populus x berolinensis]|nr:hypothetical protein NC652_038334 [Populus alba x Populus x berolinensis]
MENKHFLVISMPGQGHINPMFQLGKCLIHAGAGRVTFATTAHGLTQVKAFPSLENLHYASFSDGFDDGIKPTNDPHRIMAELKRVGSQTLTELLLSLSKEGNPVSYLIYTLLLPWAADVARDMSIPSVFLCILSTIAFALCYCFFEERDGVYDSNDNRSPSSIEMPGLPLFTSKDMPSFLLPNDPHASTLIPLFQHHIQALEKDSKPCVLLNTSDCLEEEAIRLIRQKRKDNSEIDLFCRYPIWLISTIHSKRESRSHAYKQLAGLCKPFTARDVSSISRSSIINMKKIDQTICAPSHHKFLNFG